MTAQFRINVVANIVAALLMFAAIYAFEKLLARRRVEALH